MIAYEVISREHSSAARCASIGDTTSIRSENTCSIARTPMSRTGFASTVRYGSSSCGSVAITRSSNGCARIARSIVRNAASTAGRSSRCGAIAAWSCVEEDLFLAEHERHEQIVLGGEVAVDGLSREACLARDVGHREPAEPDAARRARKRRRGCGLWRPPRPKGT